MKQTRTFKTSPQTRKQQDQLFIPQGIPEDNSGSKRAVGVQESMAENKGQSITFYQEPEVLQQQQQTTQRPGWAVTQEGWLDFKQTIDTNCNYRLTFMKYKTLLNFYKRFKTLRTQQGLTDQSSFIQGCSSGEKTGPAVPYLPLSDRL